MGSVVGESGERYGVDETPFGEIAGFNVLFRCWDGRGRERVYARYQQLVVDGRWVRAAAMHGRAVVQAVEQTGGCGVEWPVDTVSVGNAVSGVITPVVPAAFRHSDGRGRTLESFCAPSHDASDAARRVGVLIRVCDIFAMLEAEEFVYGDLSLSSILWCDEPVDAYLLGGDRLRPRGSGGSVADDRLALAVLMHQGLFMGPVTAELVVNAWRVPGTLPAGLDPRLRVLFERAHAGVDRPAPSEWRQALMATYLSPDGSAYLTQPLSLLSQHAEYFRGTVIGPIASTAWKQPEYAPPVVSGPPSGVSVARIAALSAAVLVLLAGAIGIGMGAAVLTKSTRTDANSQLQATTAVNLDTKAIVTPQATNPPTASALPTTTVAATTAPPASDPYASVVQAYFDAINRRDFSAAWDLGGRTIENGDWNHFIHAFDDLSRDVVTVYPTGGPTVYMHLDAYHTDGSVLRFDGYYVVRDGAIVSWNVHKS
ncbi:hypothetical protein AB0N05_33860 [Nocardia sp. NPDC051030]|uniref:hypothetical protein n=1 Tax=Nocardia sp. NPDC051030 TaxID=3155162 RepID=UPI003443DB03